MTPDLAKTALQFLQRTQMSGAEVPAYVQVVQALTVIAQNDPPSDASPVRRGRKPKTEAPRRLTKPRGRRLLKSPETPGNMVPPHGASRRHSASS